MASHVPASHRTQHRACTKTGAGKLPAEQSPQHDKAHHTCTGQYTRIINRVRGSELAVVAASDPAGAKRVQRSTDSLPYNTYCWLPLTAEPTYPTGCSRCAGSLRWC